MGEKKGGGFFKTYVIFRVGHGNYLRRLTRWVGGLEKDQNPAYVIFEWSLIHGSDSIFMIMYHGFQPKSWYT